MNLLKSQKACPFSIPILGAARVIAALAPLLLLSPVARAQTAPTITKISPVTATPKGGTVITITGSNFVSGATVSFGANSATLVTFVSATSLKATTPASTGNAEGPVNVTVTDPDALSATLTNGLMYKYPAPTITKISPVVATPKGGTSITITGTNFLSGATVAFGANSATAVTFVSGTTLKATTPASTGKAEGAVNVTVTNPDAQAATLTNGLMYQYPAPTITSISPAVATPAGGTSITITGTNFLSGATVAFGSNSATAVTFVSGTTLKATTPASTGKAEGEVNVMVTNPDAQAATLTNGLMYQYPAPTITSISPGVASTSGGTVITITGTHFLSGATAGFGPNNATAVTFVNNTTLKATAPPSTLSGQEGTVTVWVTNPDGQTGLLPQGLLYHLPPSLTSVTPASGLPGGGYTVTLNGEYFRTGATVLFGATPATSVIFNSNTTLTVTVPAQAAGAVNVTEKNSDGLSTVLKDGFTYSPVAVTQVSPPIGPTSGGNNVTIQGAGFLSGSTVMFGTAAATSVKFVSATELTAVPPPHAGGSVSVTVTNTNGSGVLANGYKFSGLPIITKISPATGPLAGGTAVTIQGFNLKTVNQVLFGGTAATIVSTSGTQLKVTNPAFPGGADPVAVEASDASGSFTAPGAFLYEITITTQGLDDGYPTFPYSNTLTATGGTPPYNWSVTSGPLPSGLTLNSSTGVISGTPAANYNQYTVGFQVKDSSTPANVANTSLTFNILFGFSAEPVPPTFFGMIIYDQTSWPTVPVGALGKGLATTWPFIEQTQGVYDWSVLDQYVMDAQTNNVPGTTTPVTLYWTNANIPPWAASDPTTCTLYTGTTISACTSMVSNIQYFEDFMTALVTRYNGSAGSPGLIQIYELWNEPNITNVFTGTYANMVTLTSAAYNIIRANNPSATILSPSPTQGNYLLSYLTTPGAPLGFDAVAIHGYPDVVDNDVPEAITGFKSVNIKLSMLEAPGVGVRPIWDTETSWGGAGAITDPNLRAGFVARSFLLHWSAGIHNMYWYGWDSPVWGTLYYPPPGIGLTPAAYAFNVTFDWMVGASMPLPCTANGGSTYSAVYTCQLTRPGGYNALAVWDTTQTCDGTCTYSNYTPNSQYTQYRDLTGAVHTISPGQIVQIGAQPILLENMSAPSGYGPGSPQPAVKEGLSTPHADQASVSGEVTPLVTPAADISFAYTGLTPVFATTAASHPSLPIVPASANLAPTSTPVKGQVPLANLVVKPGLSAPAAGTQAVDSDATLAVGATQVMQWADFRLQVFDKGANPVGNALQGNLFWSSLSPCSASVGADGTVQYDKLASVWVVAMRSGGNRECIAVSETSDATEQYYEYSLQYIDSQNPTYQMDYPKIGVWPDGYYLTFDMLNPVTWAPEYSVVCAMERSLMLVGSPNAQMICQTSAYSNNTGFFHLLPSDLDSVTPPPAGSPNYIFTFAKPVGSAGWHLYGYQFHVNWVTPSASTFTGPVQIDANAFASVRPACDAGASNCVPQPAPALWGLDSVGGYLMGKAAYRNFGTYESLVLTQALQTTATSPVGVRWYELRNLKTTASIHQKGLLISANDSATPDTFSRWMSAASEDSLGNIAIGYSISGKTATSYYSGLPGLAVDGRLFATPQNSLLTENIVFPGVSVEVPVAPKKTGRWGAVSGMAIDPVDQCTFWFTGQYEPAPGVYNWATQIVSFHMANCL
jgi:IPT/TIG domain/Cellulase (glycosyl hydrolase family 5)